MPNVQSPTPTLIGDDTQVSQEPLTFRMLKTEEQEKGDLEFLVATGMHTMATT